jgi:hypothetical protein
MIAGGVIVFALGVGCALDPGLLGASTPEPSDTAFARASANPSGLPTAEPPAAASESPEEPKLRATSEPPTEPTSDPAPPEEKTPAPSPTVIVDSPYPWHHDIVATTFWVGEIFDPTAEDGSQVISTYDGKWYENYGGCDGIVSDTGCETEARTSENDYFPTSMNPKQNPFYLDLPFDDVNDTAAFARRGEVIPWATLARFANDLGDESVSLMKNKWVELRNGDATCFGQIEDAGPGEYNDAEYVFGRDDLQPANSRFGGAGMDVSPALNGCLGFDELDGDTDTVSWRFVDDESVPDGPWTNIVTETGVIW